MSDATQVWSCGGGTQSAAIAALIVSGRLPKPDIALMVDTNREKSATWAYARGTLIPALVEIGVELAIVDRSRYATVDLYSVNGESLLLPGYSTESGQVGKMTNYCSGEWKRRVIERYLRSVGVKQAEVWMGISLDEMRRVRSPQRAWWKYRYPLIFELRMRRSECVALVESMGWPPPPRSSCWMCPNMGDAEWIEMKQAWPDDFAAAVWLEREVRQSDPHFYLHESCVPLDEVVFADGLAAQDAGCQSAFCFV